MCSLGLESIPFEVRQSLLCVCVFVYVLSWFGANALGDETFCVFKKYVKVMI